MKFAFNEYPQCGGAHQGDRQESEDRQEARPAQGHTGADTKAAPVNRFKTKGRAAGFNEGDDRRDGQEAGNQQGEQPRPGSVEAAQRVVVPGNPDRKSTRLNSSHVASSYAFF